METEKIKSFGTNRYAPTALILRAASNPDKIVECIVAENIQDKRIIKLAWVTDLPEYRGGSASWMTWDQFSKDWEIVLERKIDIAYGGQHDSPLSL